MPKLRPIWWYRDIEMTVYPGAQMTWLMLSHTFAGIVSFIEMYGAVTMQIEVLDYSLGSVGTGVILYRKGPSNTS